MKRLANRILRSTRAATAAEFAMVLPLLLLFLLGMIDVGRLMWTWNTAEKTTQMGVRMAVVTNYVASAISNQNFVGQSSLTQGDVIPVSAYGTTTCSLVSGAVSCDCVGTCPWGATTVGDLAAFNQIFNRMDAIMPELTSDKIEVVYRSSGLGFAGDPNGSDAAPLISVRMKNVAFTPMLFQLFNGSISLPDFAATLTAEDGTGTASN